MLRVIAVFLTALLFASCTITKDVHRQKTETFTETTTTIDTVVKVNLSPIAFTTSIDSVKSLSDTSFKVLPIVDTLKNANGDMLKVVRQGKQVHFEVLQKPVNVKISAKKVEKKHIIQKTVDKHKKKSLSLWYFILAIVPLAVIIAFYFLLKKSLFRF